MRPELGDVVSSAEIVRQGTVERLEDDGTVVVRFSPETAEVPCDVLQTGGPFGIVLATGDPVLCWQPDAESTRAVLLGRIGAGRLASAVSDELTLEAKESLTLRVGDGSITIRADGKILIKGKDLVSHAQRVNRIKGGSVAIN